MRQLDNWLTSYSIFTDVSEAPVAFNFWTGVSTIAGALRRQVFIDQVKFTWIPCFYIIFVSHPGVATKSSRINVGMNLLEKIPGVVIGPSSMTWQGLIQGFMDKTPQLVENKNSDINYGLLDKEYDPKQNAITIGLRELGTLLNMRDPELISVLIDLWDGVNSFERWHKGGYVKIDNPFINLIGATTHSWILENFLN